MSGLKSLSQRNNRVLALRFSLFNLQIFDFKSFINQEIQKREENIRTSNYFREKIVFSKKCLGREIFLRFNHGKLLDFDKSLVLVSNSGEFVETLRFLFKKAAFMFENEAFLHHFEKYSIDRKFIQKSLAIVDFIIQEYDSF